MDLLLFKGGIFYLGFHVDFPGCSPKYLWKQVGVIEVKFLGIGIVPIWRHSTCGIT